MPRIRIWSIGSVETSIFFKIQTTLEDLRLKLHMIKLITVFLMHLSQKNHLHNVFHHQVQLLSEQGITCREDHDKRVFIFSNLVGNWESRSRFTENKLIVLFKIQDFFFKIFLFCTICIINCN